MIDPNVLVSAVITPTGATAVVADLVRSAVLVPVVSPALLAELRRVLNRSKFRRYLSLQQADVYIQELEQLGQPESDPPAPPRVSADPDDDYLVGLARSAKADALVSGDAHLTDLDLLDVTVLTPRQLLDRLGR